jgi:putative MATE family efflux protein
MQDLTTGSVSRHLLKTMSFMLVALVFQTLYFLVDLYWVGRLGKEAVAGVGVAGNLMFIVLAVTQMLAVGTTTLVSHAAGRKDQERAHRVFNQGLVLGGIIAVVFLALAMLGRKAYANALAADATTASLAVSYLNWFIPATALQFPLVVMGAALRGVGNFKPGMVVQTATVVLNMILAPILIFGWGTGHALGVAGAAIATLVSIVVGTLWFLLYFLPHDAYLKLDHRGWSPNVALWGAMLSIGLPAGAEFALVAVYLFIVYAISRPFGAAAQAGFGIGMRVLQASFMPVIALGFAVAPVAGQNYGARLADRVRAVFRSAAWIAAGVMTVLAIVCHLIPGRLIGIFSSDPQVIAVGVEYLRILSFNFVASGIIYVMSSTFQAIGNTVPSLVSSLVRIVLVAAAALVMVRMPGFQLRWMWYASVAAVTIQFVLAYVLLRREMNLRLAFPNEPAAAAPGAGESASAPAEAAIG